MTITKKEEAELLKVYNTWWDSYLSGDVKTYDSFLDDDFRFVGSTEGEEFLDKKDTTAFFEATAEQLAGKAKLSNIVRTIEPLEGMVLITDLADAYIINRDDWVYYARFRFTSLLRKTKKGWRFFYQHFSIPDLKAQEGETLGFDKVTAENLELRNAIKRRTAELELKNRDLEIEAALGRIRAKVTAMNQSSDLLDIVVAMRTEFVKLGHEAHYFWHMRWLPNMYQKAMTSGDGSRIGMIMELPRDFHSHYEGMTEWENNQEPIIVLALETEIAVDYVDKMIRQGNFQQVDHNAPSLDDVRHIGGLTFISARTTHGEIGYSLPGVVKNPPKEDLNILVRFAGAFDLAHKRFEDLRQSEQQVRETKIELGLERVRARAMAMYDSSELGEVASLLFEQIRELGIEVWTTGFNVWLDNDNIYEDWITSPKGGFIEPYKVDTTKFPVFIEVREAKQRGDTFFVQYVEGEMLKRMYEQLSNFAPVQFEKMLEDGFQFPKHQYDHFVFGSSVSLMFITFEPLPEAHDIFKRFGKVFEQTYTRFLDLQKAEAQAREAQIEAALERVRSRTMGMQRSDELLDVGAILYQETIKLGIPNLTSGFVLVDEDKKIDWNYLTDPVDGSLLPNPVGVPNDETEEMRSIVKSWKKQDPFHIIQMNEQETIAHQTFIAERSLDFDITPEQLISISPKKLALQSFNFKQGYLLIVGAEPLPAHQLDMMLRFTKVFEMTYRRFLDLQKAEAQAREAQIETALERVRSRTMAMQKSDELLDAAEILSIELVNLEIPHFMSGFILVNETAEKQRVHMGVPGQGRQPKFYLPLKGDAVLENRYKSWKNAEPIFYQRVEGKKLAAHMAYVTQYFGSEEMVEAGSKIPDPVIFYCGNFKEGYLQIISEVYLNEEQESILARFTKIFQQTYTRFLDLQKAEAQTREVQIEAALERVRSKTMAMHNSEDVGHTVISFFDEVMKLGLDKSIRCGIGILENGEEMETWSANLTDDGEVVLKVGLLNMKIHPMLRGLRKAWDSGKKGYSYDYIGEDVYKYYSALNNEPEYAFNADLDALPENEYHNSFFFSSGIIFAFSENRISVEACRVLDRFSDVFGQTYRRYLDLLNAEAQAKEAHIEGALEKVRARTMAMQSSSELQEAANLLFLEVQALGINAWSAGYNILSDDKTTSTCWMSSEGELQDPFPLYYTEEASFIEMGKFLKSEEDFFVQELEGEAVVQHYDYMRSLPELKKTFQHIEDVGLTLPTYQINHLCKFSQGYLLFITYESVPDAHDIFKRFTKVFEQTYTRFLDLKKAENQSKEAQIELALERVRASSMAMHKSEQLAETAEVLFEQFDLLGIIPDRISIAIFNEKKRLFELWSTDQSGAIVDHGHDFSIDEPTCMSKTYKAWKEGKETFTVDLKGKELKDWIRYVKEEAKMELDESKFKGRRVQHCAFFSQGYLLLSSHMPITNETEQLLLRFAKVFQQTYTRFLDLQKAETQAREVIKNASVDRVRAEIASMRTTTDLKRITPLVWNELTTLDVPFIRCGVFIMDEELQQVQTHLSTPDGKAIASFHLPFEDTAPLDQLLPHWRKKEMFIDYWDESAFIESTKILMQRGAITSSETYITKNRPTSLHLHFFPFLQGMLYVGSEVSLTEYELNLAQNLAEAFSSAYARYEDFNKLELANIKIEKTLVDLKQTQTQLIQSEKMASLGELTAGIAHEIQNPLNFVNNFSEVSTELVEEMNEEIKKGNLDFAKVIATDLKQNLDKINHHGKRAGEIVKGMLQHSRTSSGQKELTNINALADEYLRLAYHGLRAKDKSFNAKIDSHFDPDLPELIVIPQDIGRVILNLITNAFYAVKEKKKQEPEGYEPLVSVSTRKTGAKIEIKVKDNGNGIPKKVLDKIFQPFFTTKPTGQGTGLGLSLSYDIIKAHGGEIKVETKEEVGTTFIIQLTTL